MTAFSEPGVRLSSGQGLSYGQVGVSGGNSHRIESHSMRGFPLIFGSGR
jgi:hypothetical protein